MGAGGLVKSRAKTKAVRKNGELGGRRRKYPALSHHDSKSHWFQASCRGACGYRKQKS
jgi:hypothetical protein